MIDKPPPTRPEPADPPPNPPDSGLALGHRLWWRHVESRGVVSRAALQRVVDRVRRSPLDRLPMLGPILRRVASGPDADVTGYSWPFLVPGPYSDATSPTSAAASGPFERTAPRMPVVAARVARRPPPTVPTPGPDASAPTAGSTPIRLAPLDFPESRAADVSAAVPSPEVFLAGSPGQAILEAPGSAPSVVRRPADPLPVRAERPSLRPIVLPTVVARSVAVPVALPPVPPTIRPAAGKPDAARARTDETDATVESTELGVSIVRRHRAAAPIRVVPHAPVPSSVTAGTSVPVARSSQPDAVEPMSAGVLPAPFNSPLSSTAARWEGGPARWPEAPGVLPANPEAVRRAPADQDDEDSLASSSPSMDRAIAKTVVVRQPSPAAASEPLFVFAPAATAMPDTSARGHDAMPGLMRTWDGADLSASSPAPETAALVPTAGADAAGSVTPGAEDLVDRVARSVLRRLTVEGERRGWSRWS